MLTAQFKVNERIVGSLLIHNGGTGTQEFGNYDIELNDGTAQSFARIEEWPRKQRRSWELVRRALEVFQESLDAERTLSGAKAKAKKGGK